MKRKLIFVILVAMILAPLSTFAVDTGKLYLDYDRAANEVTISGSGFAAGELVAILTKFGDFDSPPVFSTADGIDQTFAGADGKFVYTIPTAGTLSVGDYYWVQAASASLAGALEQKSVYIGGASAILQAPLYTTVSIIKGVIDIGADYPGAYTVMSSNPTVLKVVSPASGDPLNGIQVQGLKAGSAVLIVTAGGQTASIMVTVTY